MRLSSADRGGCYPEAEGWRLRWITPSEICRILHILQKPNSIIALIIIHSKYFPVLKGVYHFAPCFSAHQNNTTLSPAFLSQLFNNLQQAALLRHFDVIGSIIYSGLHFWHISLVQYLVNSSWLWWIKSSVLTNQKQRNILI